MPSLECFNPRSRVGSDPVQLSTVFFQLLFQSTLPRRERQGSHYLHTRKVVFQSTLPRRERRTVGIPFLLTDMFQSTLPRRERQGRVGMSVETLMFQSTLPRRERLIDDVANQLIGEFQSTLPRRERLYCIYIFDIILFTIPILRISILVLLINSTRMEIIVQLSEN